MIFNTPREESLASSVQAPLQVTGRSCCWSHILDRSAWSPSPHILSSFSSCWSLHWGLARFRPGALTRIILQLFFDWCFIDSSSIPSISALWLLSCCLATRSAPQLMCAYIDHSFHKVCLAPSFWLLLSLKLNWIFLLTRAEQFFCAPGLCASIRCELRSHLFICKN